MKKEKYDSNMPNGTPDNKKKDGILSSIQKLKKGENGHPTETDKRKKRKKFFSFIKLLLLFLIVIAIPLYILLFHRDTLKNFRSFQDILSFLQGHKGSSALIYTGIQILQIVISIIPGQFFQAAAGYLFGFFLTLLLSLVGACVGSVICYYLGDILGRDAVALFLKPEQLDHYVKRLNSKKAYILLFFIYLIPGLPKDIMGYVAGISDMKLKAFLPLSLLGRTPAMCGSILMGSLYYAGHNTALILIGVFAVLVTSLCVLFRKKINEKLNRLYDKVQE